MDKLDKQFESGQILSSSDMNSITSKVDEIVDDINNNIVHEAPDESMYLRSKSSWIKYKYDNYNNLDNKPRINNVELIENKSLMELGIQKIEYVEGTSDDEGYITSEIAPENSLIISRMYLHPTLNMWCHCPSYESSTKGDKIITGGIKYGVAVVVGGSTCQTFPNCRYRTYFIRQ